MKFFTGTYHLLPLLEAPGIHTDLLWDLGLLFTSITTVYFLLIFVFRSRISGKRKQVRLRKKELAPMISNFLFFQQDTDIADREDYIRMKIEIRQLLKYPLNREVLSEVLMDLRHDVSGEVQVRLFNLYQDLGLHRDAFKKLGSWHWVKVSQGILELTEMQVWKSYHIIKRHVNDHRSIIRLQAQLAIVSLRDEGISFFLDTVSHRISEWQQLKLMEILMQREDFDPPRFKRWLISENRDVVLFSLRLIKHYKQNDAAHAIITLLGHCSQTIKVAALECIKEFRFAEAANPLKQHFKQAHSELKVLILDALEPVSKLSDLTWLQKIAERDESFLVRTKAGSVINILKPDTVLPTKDILTFPFEEEPSGVEFDTVTEVSEVNSPEISDLKELLTSHKGDGDKIPFSFEPDFSLFDKLLKESASLAVYSDISETPLMLPDLHLPDEPWTQQHEEVFEHCLMQELKEILFGDSRAVKIPHFLTQVIDRPITKQQMKTKQPCPEWIRKMEIIMEILPSDSGYVKMLKEILLEDLEETDRVLNTDFIPWVSDSQAGEMEGDTAGEIPPEAQEIIPAFGVNSDGIEEASSYFVGEEKQSEPLSKPENTEDDFTYFSIFREFFRSYDTDSKLILMDEIPEVGTEKELDFLQTLFSDPDPKIRQKARKTYLFLAKRLGIEPKALRAKGSTPLWTPKEKPQNRLAEEGEEFTSASAVGEKAEAESELGFIPEFEPGMSSDSMEKKPEISSLIGGYIRLLNYLKGTAEQTDE